MSTSDGLPELPNDVVPRAVVSNETFWRHKNGNHYRMLGIAIRESDLEPLVMYREIDHFSEVGPVWVRIATEFFDGRFEPYTG